MSTFESVGLFVTLSLGGLGMFLVVLSVTFVFAKLVTKPAEFERFEDCGETVREYEDYVEYVDLVQSDRKDIFVIEEGEVEALGRPKHDQCEAPSRNVLSTFWNGVLSGKLKENLFGEKFIELKP